MLIKKIISHFILNVIALYLLTLIFNGKYSFLDGVITITSDNIFQTLLIAGVIFSFANITIKPILKIISFPLKVFSFGLIIFVVNGITLMIVHFLLPEYHISSFLTAIEGAFIISIFHSIAHWIFD